MSIPAVQAPVVGTSVPSPSIRAVCAVSPGQRCQTASRVSLMASISASIRSALVFHAGLPMIAGLLLPAAASDLLYPPDRVVAKAGPRSTPRHGCRLRRWDDDRGATHSRRLVDRDRVVSAVTLEMSPSTASMSFRPVGTSSASPTVSVCATIAPDPSTPRCSFFQPRRPRPPCFTAAHSPSPKIESPVSSTMRWVGPVAGTRWNLTSRC